MTRTAADDQKTCVKRESFPRSIDARFARKPGDKVYQCRWCQLWHIIPFKAKPKVLFWQPPTTKPRTLGHYFVRRNDHGTEWITTCTFEYLMLWLSPTYDGEILAWAGPIAEPVDGLP